ncbi:MAG TPA: ArsR family transcriptional regulator, partial [Pyrodictium delaneyi]|nr:ArsR family transcriptional regulator [Pyrodictium delaneyi]
EVSERLGIPKSTAYKKLQELVARGLAEYDQRSRRYTATEKAYVNA